VADGDEVGGVKITKAQAIASIRKHSSELVTGSWSLAREDGSLCRVCAVGAIAFDAIRRRRETPTQRAVTGLACDLYELSATFEALSDWFEAQSDRDEDHYDVDTRVPADSVIEWIEAHFPDEIEVEL
jgi:hypothetical protein